MITLRMLGIAVAILLGIPLAFGLAQLPVIVEGGQVLEMSADAAATVTNLSLVEPPQTYNRSAIYDWPEQLVEGHTVFLQILIPLVPDVRNWTLDLTGDISCQVVHSEEGVYFGPIPIPTRINEAHVECHAAGQVFVTPDPFVGGSQSYHSPLSQTGDEIPFTTPGGASGVATEYSYILYSEDAMGELTSRTLYAWSVPIMDPWVDADGSVRRWYCPMPVARLQEMGLDHFDAYVVEEPDDLFGLMLT